MLSLDDPQWMALSGAYGSSVEIPKLLAKAETLPEHTDARSEPYFSLWSALCHQGDVYPASYAALPHLVRIVEENPGKFRWTLLALAQAIEAARLKGRGPQIPNDLRGAYETALARIPALAARILSGDVTELELRVTLSACASAKGFALLSEAINELEPEIVAQLLDNWRFQ